MEITLRRAAALQDLIRETRHGLSCAPVVAVSVYGDPSSVVQQEREALFARVARMEALTEALYEIRQAVARANVDAGVSDLLAQQASLGFAIERLTSFAEARPFEGEEITRRRADRASSREEPTSVYGRSTAPTETIQVSLLTAEDIEAARVNLLETKRQKTAIKDRLAELNAMTRIALSPRTEATLIAEHLL